LVRCNAYVDGVIRIIEFNNNNDDDEEYSNTTKKKKKKKKQTNDNNQNTTTAKSKRQRKPSKRIQQAQQLSQRINESKHIYSIDVGTLECKQHYFNDTEEVIMSEHQIDMDDERAFDDDEFDHDEEMMLRTMNEDDIGYEQRCDDYAKRNKKRRKVTYDEKSKKAIDEGEFNIEEESEEEQQEKEAADIKLLKEQKKYHRRK
jgi:hypothetical protein